jgi:hypothetical protein
MIGKFAGVRGTVLSEFLDLNHTGKPMILVSLMISKFAPEPASSTGELRNRDTNLAQWVCTGLQPAAMASASLQNQRLPLSASMRICAYQGLQGM